MALKDGSSWLPSQARFFWFRSETTSPSQSFLSAPTRLPIGFGTHATPTRLRRRCVSVVCFGLVYTSTPSLWILSQNRFTSTTVSHVVALHSLLSSNQICVAACQRRIPCPHSFFFFCVLPLLSVALCIDLSIAAEKGDTFITRMHISRQSAVLRSIAYARSVSRTALDF